MRKIWRLMGQEQPRTLVLLCALTLAGAALSPDFLSPAFPQTRLSGSAVFQQAAAALPWLFTPAAWSLWHALGSMLVMAALWQGALYAFPSLRVRQGGPAASLKIGGAVSLSISGGLIGQTGATEVGLLAALALGILAAASSLVRDFFDIDADRQARLRTLPLLVGRDMAVSINMAAVTAAYLLAIFLLLQRIGMQERVLGLFGLTLGAHLHVLRQLGQDPSPTGARRAGRYVMLIFLGVTALYVAAQA
jgi:1,4-dihydroxy-2-naphthoate octaprenyltransferase